ncbi:MAG: beta-lactamase family protein [Ectothiorhodospiraceae bacterium]|nr:beta-lactamase family protein [Ectothiorhodospiraceae bacterium]
MSARRFGADDARRVDAVAADLVARYHLPGLGLGVVRGAELVHAAGYGWADIEARRPHGPGVRQRIGSITKTMVALCLMRLVDAGRLGLDARVLDLLPELRLHGHGDRLTVRHLMTHTGGIGEAPTIADVANPLRRLWCDAPRTQSLVEKYPTGIEIEVPPGTKWHYANHGWMLLGEVLARLEGEPVEAVLARRIFAPLGMADTDLHDRRVASLSVGYRQRPSHEALDQAELVGVEPPDGALVDGHNFVGPWVHVDGRAAGAVQSTVEDMARYAAAMLARGAGIVAPPAFDSMLEAHWCPDPRLMSMGLGFFRYPRLGEGCFGHTGGVEGGWSTDLTVVPGHDTAIVVHLNLYTDDAREIFARIARAVLGLGPVEVRGEMPTPEARRRLVGVYSLPPGKLTNSRPLRAHGRLQVTDEAGELVLRSRRGAWRQGVRLLPADPADDHLFALDVDSVDPPRVAFVRDAAGMVSGLRLDRMAWMPRDQGLEPWA